MPATDSITGSSRKLVATAWRAPARLTSAVSRIAGASAPLRAARTETGPASANAIVLKLAVKVKAARYAAAGSAGLSHCSTSAQSARPASAASDAMTNRWAAICASVLMSTPPAFPKAPFCVAGYRAA